MPKGKKNMQERKRRRKERGREKGIKPRWIKNTFQEKTPHKTEKKSITNSLHHRRH